MGTGLPALTMATPALAQGLSGAGLAGAMPIAIAVGAASFALIAALLFRRTVKDAKAARTLAGTQIASLRALVDEYEALLAGVPEITVLWAEHGAAPRFLGQAAAILPAGRRPEAVLDFATWLAPAESRRLAAALEALRVDGHGFDIRIEARDGRVVRAMGWVLGGGTVLRLRPALLAAPSPAPVTGTPPDGGAEATGRAMLAGLAEPAFLRDPQGRLCFANAAYLELAAALGHDGSEASPPDILAGPGQAGDPAARADRPRALSLGSAGDFELIEFPVPGGSAGYLRAREAAAAEADAGLTHLSGIIDALATPIAIFNADRELVQVNRAYCALWDLSPEWLTPGTDEGTILDRLRTNGVLPNEPDYHAWRSRHLASYQLTAPTELEPWHLPDGRTVQVIAAPAGPRGGVIYVFEDITDHLHLKSQHQALLEVQRSTLNSLSEGVAVFGTNGRLTLSNPRLSLLWKLPSNLLQGQPHIDEIAAAAAQALPEDGAAIWRDLKHGIIDLNPTRSDQSGRIARADGKLLDFAIVRLPDGQTMMTFLDVTESANYQRVLKERNDALITADRLKDAFVQNVSYELRSPLTNIIGFADLLASESAGTLNARQRAYTDYIRASSVTLGVLIDNILDLATVDAGIAELRPEPQDVRALVEKARAGLAATFPEVDGERSINLVTDIDPDLPNFVADGTRIVQVLYNLLSSAARFSEPGGEVRLRVTARGERMLFVVEDEGAAMSEEMRMAILEREDGPVISGRQRGAGLGLAIVRSFVNLHGGTIAVEPREPRGSRVIVNLPLDAPMVGIAE